MVKRVNLSQFRSKIRQLQSKQRQAAMKRRQAVNKYNQAVRRYNDARRRAIEAYNREVRAYNSRVRQHRQRLHSELTRLKNQRSSRYITYRTTVNEVQTAYQRLDVSAESREISASENLLLDLSEGEAANSAAAYNALTADEKTEADRTAADELQQTIIGEELSAISEDLDSRWRGALYALGPENPDAARHFCSSSREIFTQLIHLSADDEEVLNGLVDCETTDRGKPTRRSRLKYMLARRGANGDEFVDFVEADINDVLELFDLFQSGTHGESGRYDRSELGVIKRRAEGAILFLCRLAA